MKYSIAIIILIIAPFAWAQKEEGKQESLSKIEESIQEIQTKIEKIENELTSKPTESPEKAYIEILEKTNSQLSVWTNPYGIMVGIVSALTAILAIGVAKFGS